MDTTAIRARIEQAMPDAKVEVTSGDGVHFEALVIDAGFAGKSPLARHRLVYAALDGAVGGDIHALGVRTLTPDEAARG